MNWGQELQVVVQEQTWRFFMSVVLGAGLGVLYDVLRVLRLGLPHNTAAVFLEDTGFWCVAGLSAQLFFYYTDDGFFRLYILLGMGIGFVLYHFTVGVVVMGAANRILACIRCAVRFMRRKLWTPVAVKMDKVGKNVKSYLKSHVFVKKTVQKQGKTTAKSKNALAKRSELLYNQRKPSDNRRPFRRNGKGHL